MSSDHKQRWMAVFSDRAMQRLAELRARKLELLNTLTDDEVEEMRWIEDYLQTRNGETGTRKGRP